MRFSERIGKKQVRQELQIDGIDEPLRTSLWNIVYMALFEPMSNVRHGTMTGETLNLITRRLWLEFFKWHIYKSFDVGDSRERVFKWFLKAEWYEVYDFLEFLSSVHSCFGDKFRNSCNVVLESEHSAYRFVGDKITPIVNDIEIQEVEQAAESSSTHKLEGARKHLDAALEKLSDRQNPDYRNSIKESISAVESVCAIISGDTKATLGQALKKITDSVGLHPALEKGMSSIYGYTSDAGGIRHAMIEESNCDLADAKYMLVSCSAFINYLIMKVEKAGLLK
jgi:hypothetical protein